MENVLSVFMLLIATIVIALVVFAITAVFSGFIANSSAISSYASDVAQGLYISKTVAVSTGNYYSIVIVPTDFNYNGTIYLTAVAVNPSLYGSNQISPYQGNFTVEINGTIPTSTPVTLYTTSLHELYAGNVPIWKSVTGATQLVSIPNGYDAIVWIFIPTQKGLVEVGYVWLKD
ncbi:hypothetical protein [Stygiolobus azoricus]|uniref:Flagellin n=1 Tax=Stygiolobus azoricus TaxID=41675 RepID=A0A650CPE4_9CREN|nr:hypothetical protein [Stygiolobus azoricus]QGR19710.1 hypothetical protein D1868_06680 [Stygiolobus azoricus]